MHLVETGNDCDYRYLISKELAAAIGSISMKIKPGQ